MTAKKRPAPAKVNLPAEVFIVHNGQLDSASHPFEDPGDAVAEAEMLASDEGAPWYVAKYLLIAEVAHHAKKRRTRHA